MKRILVVSGSRADYGLLEFPLKKLREEPSFEVEFAKVWGCSAMSAMLHVEHLIRAGKYDLMLILGDRHEILGAALAAHLARLPIAHIGGGDVTEGSYDDAMRDAISRMANIHFVTSTSAMARLSHLGYRNVHLVGNPGIDFIRHAEWRSKERPIIEPYVVVSYQAETIDKTNDIEAVLLSLDPKVRAVFMLPNPDLLAKEISATIATYAFANPLCTVHEFLPHAEFLNLIAHCEEFIGNSSAMLYEAPELGIKTRMIGKRQRGRTIPMGDGFASERIVKILRYT